MKRLILILIAGLVILFSACKKDKTSNKKPCELNQTGNIQFLPTNTWLYRVTIRDTAFSYIDGGYIDDSIGVDGKNLSFELPAGVYNVSIMAWYTNLTYPDSIYNLQEFSLAECDTLKIGI